MRVFEGTLLVPHSKICTGMSMYISTAFGSGGYPKMCGPQHWRELKDRPCIFDMMSQSTYVVIQVPVITSKRKDHKQQRHFPLYGTYMTQICTLRA